jgi:hypothetical protein
MALGWMGATMALASVVKNPNSSSLPLAGELAGFRGDPGEEGERPAREAAAAVSIWVRLSVRQSLEEVWRSGAEARGQVAGIARSMSRTIAMKAFAAGDKVCPFYLRTLASNVHKSGGISTAAGPGPVAAAVTCDRARTKQTKKPAGVVPAGSDCSALSAMDRSA